MLNCKKKKKNYSNTIELYDIAPKYMWNKKKKYKKLKNVFLKSYFNARGKKILMKIIPAKIKNKLFNKIFIYPSQSEEIMEDVLSKFAVHGQSYLIDGKIGVQFSLYQLYKELKKMGHEYNLYEIKESIMVCSKSIMKFLNIKKKKYSLFPKMSLCKQYSSKKSNKCYVQFNPMMHKCILNLSFSKYNYNLGMSIFSPFASYMYKSMSHYYIQANMNKPYTLNLMNFLSFSCSKISKRMSENISSMKNALTLLMDKKMIKNYFFITKKKKYKILDITYIIYPSKNFIKQVMNMNKMSFSYKNFNKKLFI